jgi:hypothetical protein
MIFKSIVFDCAFKIITYYYYYCEKIETMLLEKKLMFKKSVLDYIRYKQ